MSAKPIGNSEVFELQRKLEAMKLFTGTVVSKRISFHTLSRNTHNRLRQQMYDPETGEVVRREDQVKGYEFEKGRFVIVEPEEVEALRIESTQIIDIERFVDRSDIDTLYWDSPYYMVPDGKFAYEAFAVIREAIDRQGVVGIGRMVMSNRERPVALQPRGNWAEAPAISPSPAAMQMG